MIKSIKVSDSMKKYDDLGQISFTQNNNDSRE